MSNAVYYDIMILCMCEEGIFMTKFLLVRHGQSLANLQERFAGHYDAPLTEHGQAQARAVGKYVAEHYDVDAIYSSDLSRAYDTARPASLLLGIDIIPEKGLREIFEGKWSGERFVDIKENFSEDFNHWRTDIGTARCTGGESTEELLFRVRATLTRIAEENDGKTVLIATHATPIRVMQTFVETGDLRAMQKIPWVTNASISEVVYSDGEWRFEAIGITDHLGDLAVSPPKNV